MRTFAYISPLVIAIAIFEGCCIAQELANCFSGEACRNTAISFGVVEQCCNSPAISRSYMVPGTEECVECRFTYRCYVSEQCGSDPSPVWVTTFAINDGERVCCNGNFTSWDVSSSPTGGSSCAVCPEPITMSMSTAETTVPLTTIEVDSSSQSTDPDATVNINPAQSGSGGCSTGCIVGIVVGCVVLVLLVTVITVIIVVLIIKK